MHKWSYGTMEATSLVISICSVAVLTTKLSEYDTSVLVHIRAFFTKILYVLRAQIEQNCGILLEGDLNKLILWEPISIIKTAMCNFRPVIN